MKRREGEELRHAGAPQWYARLAVMALAATVPGCAATKSGALYNFHQQVRIGQPFPASPNALPPAAEVTDRPNERTLVLENRWKCGMFDEYCTYLLDDSGTVTAKRYVLDAAEAYLLVAWQYQRCVSEWEVHASPDSDLADAHDACDRLGKAGGLAHAADADDYEQLLFAVANEADWRAPRFEFRMTAPSKKPSSWMFLGRPSFSAKRTDDGMLRLTIEDRSDVCPLVTTPVAWLSWPFTRF